MLMDALESVTCLPFAGAARVLETSELIQHLKMSSDALVDAGNCLQLW